MTTLALLIALYGLLPVVQGDAPPSKPVPRTVQPERAYGRALPSGAEHVRWCESRDDYGARNPASTASGGWQFLDGTWADVTGLAPPADAYDRATQDDAFVDLWDGGAGAFHWAASRDCWEPLMRQDGLDVPP